MLSISVPEVASSQMILKNRNTQTNGLQIVLFKQRDFDKKKKCLLRAGRETAALLFSSSRERSLRSLWIIQINLSLGATTTRNKLSVFLHYLILYLCYIP